MTLEELCETLYALRKRKLSYGLERMEALVEALGHPERKRPYIHVAGSNGKGSVCAMLERMLRAGGYRTGLFTSPHLVYLGERVRLDGIPLEEAQLCKQLQNLLEQCRQLEGDDPQAHPSFFELMAALAFRVFDEAEVDVAVMETGLGGRLDASNVLTPALSVITSISLEHTDLLGDSLAAIAGEKAGILKEGVPLVLAPVPEEAREVILARAAARHCPVYETLERFPDEAGWPSTNLSGRLQRLNAATAWHALEVLSGPFPLAPKVRREALQQVDWPGRWQRMELDNGQLLILDATHNAEALPLLEEHLDAFGGELDIAVGILGEERARDILPLLAERANTLHLLEPKQPRAVTREHLQTLLPPTKALVVESEISQLLAERRERKGRPLLITGSLYLLGEALEALGHRSALNLQDVMPVVR